MNKGRFNFFSAGEDETVDSLAKHDWNPHLGILEQLIGQNSNVREDDRGKVFGLTASQINQIVDSLIAWTDREFRYSINSHNYNCNFIKFTSL